MSKYEARLQKLETGSHPMNLVHVCQTAGNTTFSPYLDGTCQQGGYCECRAIRDEHMAKSRGRGSFAMIPLEHAGL